MNIKSIEIKKEPKTPLTSNKVKEKHIVITPDSKKVRKSSMKNNSEYDSDDCLDLDVSVFNKPKQEPKPAPQKNTEMQLRVSNHFQDKDNKNCVLVTMKTNFYTLKANAITAVLKLFFESILQWK